MNANYLVNILCQAHIEQTNLPSPPFSYRVEFNPETLNKDKYKLISGSNEELEKFVSECFKEFLNSNPNIRFGSVHTNPKIWTKFALKTIAIAYKNSQNNVVFPNGCCSKGVECPINVFYGVVLKNIII